MKIGHYQLNEFKKENASRGVKTIRRSLGFATHGETGSGKHPMDWDVTNLVLTAADSRDLLRYELSVHSVPSVFMNAEDETFMGMGRQALKKLERALWDLSRNFFNGHGIAWLPIICPERFDVLSQRTASNCLACLGCGRGFALTEVKGSG